MNAVENWRDLLKGKKGRDIMVMIMHNEHNVLFPFVQSNRARSSDL